MKLPDSGYRAAPRNEDLYFKQVLALCLVPIQMTGHSPDQLSITVFPIMFLLELMNWMEDVSLPLKTLDAKQKIETLLTQKSPP